MFVLFVCLSADSETDADYLFAFLVQVECMHCPWALQALLMVFFLSPVTPLISSLPLELSYSFSVVSPGPSCSLGTNGPLYTNRGPVPSKGWTNYGREKMYLKKVALLIFVLYCELSTAVPCL